MLAQAMSLVGKRGRLVVVNVHPDEEREVKLSLRDLQEYEKQIRGCMAGSWHGRRGAAFLLDLAARGRLSPICDRESHVRSGGHRPRLRGTGARGSGARRSGSSFGVTICDDVASGRSSGFLLTRGRSAVAVQGQRSCKALSRRSSRAVGRCWKSVGKIILGRGPLLPFRAVTSGFGGAPGRIRTCAPASGGRCSIP